MIKPLVLLAFVAHICCASTATVTEEAQSSKESASRLTCVQTKCRANETYSECPILLCQPQTCDQLGSPIACPAIAEGSPCPGKPGCICKDGFVRNNKGICIPKAKCPSCGGDRNAVSGCGVNCGRHCNNYNKGPVACIDICYFNACNCREGYVYDDNTKKCVKPEKCTPVCGNHEVYSTCVNGGCDARNCTQYGKPVPCVKLDPKSCIKGCVCEPGYLRALNGTCVPETQCEASSCKGDPNATPGCGSNCGRLCSNYKNKPTFCTLECRLDGCDCKENYVLDENTGKCVLPGQCSSPCTKKNEEYEICPAKCPFRTCGIDDKLVRCAPPLQPGDPNCPPPACRCKSGFFRDSRGECVPWEQCQQCKQNEELSTCVQGVCRHQNCTQIGRPLACPAIAEGSCKVGCVCKQNFYRNSEGLCVPQDKCEKPVCNVNEEYSSCSNGICRPGNCAEKGTIILCKPMIPGSCIGGCVCKSKHLRDDSGTCIPEDQCENCPEGEVFSTCPAIKCDAEYCPQSRNDPASCPIGIVCDKPRCTCGFNQRKDRKTGKCIATASCPPFKCDGPNEKYESCPSVCPGERCIDYLNNATCPRYRIGIVVPCVPQCRCNEGFKRNSEGICINSASCQASEVADLQKQLDRGNLVFTLKFLTAVAKQKPNTSVIMSAFSVLIPLSELALYSSGPAYIELMAALNLKTKDDIRRLFPALLDQYNAQKNIELKLANKIYANQRYALSKEFLKDTTDIFHAPAENLNFGEPVLAASIINKWVEDQTNNKIKDLVPSSALSEDTRIAMINAIYFKGDWVNQFNPNNTIDRDFNISNEVTKQVPTMFIKKRFNYAESEELGAKLLEMPYKGYNMTYLVLLPDKTDGLSDLISKIADPQVFERATKLLKSAEVNVYLPKILTTTTIDLKNALQETNVKQIFNTSNSGISGVLEIPEDIAVTSAIQKAFIEVNELGSEAAAANALIVGVTSIMLPDEVKEFNANHPYLYMIRYRGNPIFLGTYYGD